MHIFSIFGLFIFLGEEGAQGRSIILDGRGIVTFLDLADRMNISTLGVLRVFRIRSQDFVVRTNQNFQVP